MESFLVGFLFVLFVFKRHLDVWGLLQALYQTLHLLLLQCTQDIRCFLSVAHCWEFMTKANVLLLLMNCTVW